MPREGTIDLLNDVEECLEAMKKTDQIKPVKIKSILENLRSALEYIANDTYDKYNSSGAFVRPKIYFPYGEQQYIDNFFIKKLQIRVPSSSPMYSVFCSVQKNHSGENWLEMMCDLTNDAKHRQPIPLKQDEVVKDITIEVGGFGLIKANGNANINFGNNFFNGHKLTDFTYKDGVLDNKNNGIPINIKMTKERKIRFHGVDYEVIPFLDLCHKNIRTLIINAYDVLDSI